MTIDKVQLKALAEAATQGPWHHTGTWVSTERGNSVADCSRGDDEFIAAANPATILALLHEIEINERRLHDVAVLCATVEQERDQLKAENEALRLDADRYRWLSVEGNWVARFHGKWRAHVGAYGEACPTDWYGSREEAIDAAMAKEQSHDQ